MAALLTFVALPDRSQPAEPCEPVVIAAARPMVRRRRRRGQGAEPWRLTRLGGDVVRVGVVAGGLGPGVAVVLAAGIVVRELLLTAGLACGWRTLLRAAVAADRCLRCTLRLLVGLSLVAGLNGDGAVVCAAAVVGAPEPPPVTVDVAEGRARLRFHGPAVLELPTDTEQDERLAMVLCRLLARPADGRPLLSHQRIATAFGKNNRQDCQNHLQKLARAGGSLVRMVLNGPGGRPPTVHPEMRRRIARHWQRDPLVSPEQTHAALVVVGAPDGVPLPSVEQLRALRELGGNLVAVRSSLRRLVARDSCGVRPSALQRQLFEVVDAQDERLRRAGVAPVALPGAVELARAATELSSRPRRSSRAAVALLGALRALVAVPSADDDERLAATVGAEFLAPLHFGALYCVLRLSIGQVAALVGRSKSVVYRGLVRLDRCLQGLDPWPAASRFSGVLALDEKWVRIPKSFTDEERQNGERWRYAHFAVDGRTGDLLHVDVFETSDAEAVRAFLVAVRAKGIRPKVVVTDMLGAYAGVIRDVFGPHVLHHYCLFHHLQAVRHRLREKVGPDWNKHRLLRRLVARIDDIYRCQTRRTARRRLARVLAMRAEVAGSFPAATGVLDTLERRFPLVANAIGRPAVPATNNITERLIRAFEQHYRGMAGLESLETARIQLRLFRCFYRLTPMRETVRKEDRGLCPLERAGFDIRGAPLADFVRRFADACEDGTALLSEVTNVPQTDSLPSVAAAA